MCIYIYAHTHARVYTLDIFHLHLSPSTIMLSCSDFHAPIKSATSHHHPFHQHMDTDRLRTASTFIRWWMGCRDGKGGVRVTNSNQGAPLGALSMGYFLKHLPPSYPSWDAAESLCLWEWWPGPEVRGRRADMPRHLMGFSSQRFVITRSHR